MKMRCCEYGQWRLFMFAEHFRQTFDSTIGLRANPSIVAIVPKAIATTKALWSFGTHLLGCFTDHSILTKISSTIAATKPCAAFGTHPLRCLTDHSILTKISSTIATSMASVPRRARSLSTWTLGNPYNEKNVDIKQVRTKNWIV